MPTFSIAVRTMLLCAALLLCGAQPAAEVPQSSARNSALHAKYECVIAPNYWGWKNPQHGDHGQLTDGKIVESWRTDQGEIYALPSSMGWTGMAPVVVLDLGSVQPIGGVGLHTVLSPWGPWWPQTITVLVSDDNQHFYRAGPTQTITPDQLDPPATPDAVRAAIDRVLADKGLQPSTHWLRIKNIAAKGRYVAIIMPSWIETGTVVLDEMEVYAGPPDALEAPRTAQVFSEGKGGWKSHRLFQSIDRRLAMDIAALRKSIAASSVSSSEQSKLQNDLAALDAKRHNDPIPNSDAFQAVFPIDDLHRQVFEVQAVLWRAQKLPPLSLWHCHRWDPLSPIEQPGVEAPRIEIVMARNEVRSDVLNLSNAGDKPCTVTLSGVPSFIDVLEVPFVDTHAQEPVASALVPLAPTDGAFHAQVPAGMTKQIWIRCNSKTLNAGRFEKKIRLTSTNRANGSTEVPINIEVVDVRLPDEFSILLGGWDYASPGSYQVTDQNVDQYVAMLREYGVNNPWLAQAMPLGEYDDSGNLVSPPPRGMMDHWLGQFPDAKLYGFFMTGSSPTDPHRRKKLELWAKDWSTYLKTKGVHPDRIGILIRDEPTTTQELEDILEVGRAIKRGEPHFKIWNDLHWDDLTKAPPIVDDVLREACDIQCFELRHYQSAQQANDRFIARHARPDLQWWTYTGGSADRLADPYVAWHLRPWFSFQKGFSGAANWAFGDGHGGFSWNEYLNNGVSRTPLYLAKDSVIASKSMEAMREGAQDYELLLMLRDRAAKAGNDAAAERILTDDVDQVLQSHRTDLWKWHVPKDRSVADTVRVKLLRLLASQ